MPRKGERTSKIYTKFEESDDIVKMARGALERHLDVQIEATAQNRGSVRPFS